MINVSNEYKSVVYGQNRTFYSGAEITLLDSTVLTLDNTNIIGLKIEDAVSQSGSFTIGSAIINKLTISINNMDDAYSNYDFTGAIIRPTVGLQLSASIETLPKGVFTADDPKAIGSVITLTALDNMVKFDKPFSGVSISFPTTADLLLNAVCTYCGVSRATSTFTNSNYAVNERPLDEATSCREVLSWIAQLSGNYARCNTSGQLELKWYDFEIFEQTNYDGGQFDASTPYATGDSLNGGTFSFADGDTADGGTFTDTNRFHHIFALNNFSCATDDVVITGISVMDSSETPTTVLFGTSGYIIAITGNKLIQSSSDATIIANSVGAKIVGVKFRPCSLTAISDPSREAGDIAYVTDRKQNTYQILLSSVSFSIGSADKISCDAESASRNSAVRYNPVTKAIIEARKNTETQLTAYDLLVQQMSDVITHGYGMFQSKVTDESGATIFYLHDKATMDESTIRWFTTSEGTIEQVKTLGVWVTVSGVDKQGNALYNVLTARKVSADIIRTGKIYSDDGSTLIDMAFGVANSDNLSFIDNIQSGFPLSMPFNLDSAVSKINSVLLKFTQQAFRTYSNGASSGGSSSTTSGSGGGTSGVTDYSNAVQTDVASGDSTHYHLITAGHYHLVNSVEHTHSVSVPSHTHNLNFGIQEQTISNNTITIYVDGTLRATTSDLQGIIDLTAYITTTGWHTIEVRSTTLKRISAQINIKSYIKS